MAIAAVSGGGGGGVVIATVSARFPPMLPNPRTKAWPRWRGSRATFFRDRLSKPPRRRLADVAEEVEREAAEPEREPELAFDHGHSEVAKVEVEEIAQVEAEPVVEEAPRRRRSRRTPVRAEKEATASAETVPIAASGEDVVPAPRRRRGPRSRPAETVAPSTEPVAAESEAVETTASAQETRPSADRDVGADTAEHHAPLAEPEMQSVFTPPAPSDVGDQAGVESAEPEGQVAAEDNEPSRPKRSGWWQRAKATFSS